MNVKTALEAMLQCNSAAIANVGWAENRVVGMSSRASTIALGNLVDAKSALENQNRLINEALESLNNQIAPSEERLGAAPECNGLENAGLDKANTEIVDTLIGRIRDAGWEILVVYPETNLGCTKRKINETLESDFGVIRIRISIELKD